MGLQRRIELAVADVRRQRAEPNKDVNSAVTGTRILNPLRSSTLFNCRLDDEVIWRKPLSTSSSRHDAGLAMASRTTSPTPPSMAAQTWSQDWKAKPTLGKPDSGTSVDNVIEGATNSSMPPARSCDSISGSPPSWLLEKTVTLSPPRRADAGLLGRLRQAKRQADGHRAY